MMGVEAKIGITPALKNLNLKLLFKNFSSILYVSRRSVKESLIERFEHNFISRFLSASRLKRSWWYPRRRPTPGCKALVLESPVKVDK
jgi:hypothetical protein